MINWVFDQCVVLLEFCAAQIGISYQAINVWLFCVICPSSTIALVAIILHQKRVICQLQRYCASTNGLNLRTTQL